MTRTSVFNELKFSQAKEFGKTTLGIVIGSLQDLNTEEENHIPKYNSFATQDTTRVGDFTAQFINATSTADPDRPPGKSTFVAILICLLCGLVILGTLFGNILVCVAVAITRKLRTPTNSLIVSLAFSDLLIAITVMPFALVLEVTGNWIFGQVVCDLWTSLDVLLCTSSILNLCVISIDRYLVITRPFTYALKRTPCRMAVMVISVWLASAMISIPPQFGWRKPIKEGQCVISDEIGYQLFATVGAFYLPLLVMIIIYTRIYLVSSRLSKTVSYNRQPSLASVGVPSSPADLLTSFPEVTSTKPYECPKQRRRQSSPCLDRSCYECEHLKLDEKRRKSSSVLIFEKLKRNLKYNNSNNKHSCPSVSHPTLANNHLNLDSSVGSLTSNCKQARSRSVSHMLGKINNRLKISSTKPHKTNSDRKATRTLGVIMGSFIACWLPFFILALVKPFLGELAGKIPSWVDTIFLWLGYANSFLNPIIYARFNRDFRVPFRYILQCRCRSINNRMRVSEFAEQFGKSESSFNPNISSVPNSQHRHRLSNIRTSQSMKTSINNRSSVTTPEEQQFIQSGWKHSDDSRLTLTEKFPGVLNRTRILKVDKTKRPQSSQNLVFKRYNPQNKRNNSPMSCDVSPREVENKIDSSTTRLTCLADDRCGTSIEEAVVQDRHQQHQQRQQITFVPPANNNIKLQQPFNCKPNNNNNKFSPKKTKSPTNRDDHNRYQLFVPKAPLINMSMVIDDEDDDDDGEEDNSLRIAEDDDDEEEDEEDYEECDNEKNFNLELRGKSVLGPRLHSLDSSTADVTSYSSLHEEFYKIRHQDGDHSSSSGRNNGVLKVFTTSFNDINKEHSFVI